MKYLLILSIVFSSTCFGQKKLAIGDTIRCEYLKGDSIFYLNVIENLRHLKSALFWMQEQRVVKRIDANSLEASKHVNSDGTVWYDLLDRFTIQETSDSINMIAHNLRVLCGRFEEYTDQVYDMYLWLYQKGYYVVTYRYVFATAIMLNIEP